MDNWDLDLFNDSLDAYNDDDNLNRFDYARELNMFTKTADPDWIEWYLN